jgi:hypothetical protein
VVPKEIALRENQTDRFPDRLNLKLPVGLAHALGELAARQRTTMSDVLRQTLIREVESAGVSLGDNTGAPPMSRENISAEQPARWQR